MSGATAVGSSHYRELMKSYCNTCSTNMAWGDGQIPAKIMDTETSMKFRVAMRNSLETIQKGIFTTVEDAIDGKRWVHYYREFPNPRSRGTGGKTIFDCGDDPSTIDYRRYERVQQLEYLYINYEKCAKEFFSSAFADPNNGIFPATIRANDAISSVTRNSSWYADAIMGFTDSMIRAIDKTNIFGNFVGDNRSTVETPTGINLPDYVTNSRAGITEAPHYDGILKQVLLQGKMQYYAMGCVVLPSLDTVTYPDASYVVKWYGNHEVLTSVTDLIDYINNICSDITGDLLYSAVLADATTNKIRIIANHVEKPVYGEKGLEIYVTNDGIVENCTSALPYLAEQCPMAFSQEPCLFDFNEQFSCENSHEYLAKVLKAIMTKCASDERYSFDFDSFFNQWFIAIPPEWTVELGFSRYFQKTADGYCCDNLFDRMDQVEGIMPRIVVLDCLRNSNIWFASTQSNLMYMTNTTQQLGDVEAFYDRNCQKHKIRIEAVAAVCVMDFNKFATNAKNSPFEKKLHPPLQPLNIPHYNDVHLRADASPYYCGDISSTKTNTLQAAATINYIAPTVDGGDCILQLQNESIIPHGDSLDTIEWTIQVNGGLPLQPTIQDEMVEVTIPAAQCEAIISIHLSICTANGLESTVTIPRSAINNYPLEAHA